MKVCKESARYFVIFLFLGFALIPVVWLILTSLKTRGEWLHDPPIWVPSKLTLINYLEMWMERGQEAFMTSLTVAGIATLIAVWLGLLAAYSISRFRTGGVGFNLWILSIRFLPPIAFIVPYFILFRALGLVDTPWSLTIVCAVFNTPFVVWIMKGLFDGIPGELDESAMIDGCSHLGAFFYVVLPLAVPGIVSTGLIAFVFSWNEYLFALTFSQSELITVPVRLSMYYTKAVGLRWGPQAALAMISTLPMISLVVIGQRYLVRALSLGAIKG